MQTSTLLRGLDKPFKPIAVGDYTYASKVADECTKWTAVCLLTNKNQAFQSLQLLSARQSALLVAASFVGTLTRAASTTGEGFFQYSLETGVIQVFAITNTP